MAKSKKPSAEASDMTEGDPVEKRAQLGKSRSPRAPAKPFGPIFAIALAALALSTIALGFASFAVWQNNQRAAIESSKSGVGNSNAGMSEVAKNRFAALETRLAAYENSQKQAIAALSERLDRQADDTPIPSLGVTDKFSSNDTTDKNDSAQSAARIDQRFAALEMIVSGLTSAATVKSPNTISDNPLAGSPTGQTSLNLGATPDQASLLIVSGLLADNMAGVSLDRWIDLLQGLVDQGATIPGLAKLRILANPTPKRPYNLIRDAHDLTPKMARALYQANDDAGFMEQVGAKLGQLVQLREIGDGADGNEVALQKFEAALAVQDLDGAIRAASQWSGPDVPSLESWIALAQNRRSLDRAVNALVTERLAAAFAVQR